MAINGKVGTIGKEFEGDNARGFGHSPVIMTGKLAAGQGELPAGLILERNVSDELIPVTDPANIVGVLDETVDTEITDSANFIIHGSAKGEKLCVDVAGTAPDAAMLTALVAFGVYPEQ